MRCSIAIVTATRAEYSLLSPIIKALKKEEYDVRVIVTGAHLSLEYGLTYQQIEADGIKIDKKIEILLSSDTPVGVSKAMGLAIISFSEYFEDSKPETLMVLGDRYETLAVCCAAMNAGIPILHLYGGETTEGATDEMIRHAITKMSYLHFTSTDEYRDRVIQLGESPDRVYCVGAVGIENAMKVPILNKNELEESLSFSLGNEYAVVTFHPVTLEGQSYESQIEELLGTLETCQDMKFIITKSNADAGGRTINQRIEEYVSSHSNAIAVDSLGMVRYFSAVRYSAMVIGNSSSGLIEVPTYQVPTINIGDRQKGRTQAKSIINCFPKKEEILIAICEAKLVGEKLKITPVQNPYGDGKTTEKILKIINDFLPITKDKLKKKFYDIKLE
ncbi:UDP-N-acetylglucosamine 2-epimerase [Lachnoclostridium sp.]|uniref:UDP-N-acetylglucosamine 2-epimerase n=1 Tax=Lachnoclostridium sp. TaxID=2028282 RepID=UPI0028A123D5|nr:UDP-N-acetylglucosamine 2-epimerase [Lachnoclostridium sp.]